MIAVENVQLLAGDDTGLALLQSGDGGATWSAPECVLDDAEVATLASENGVVYVGTRGRGLLRSTGSLRDWEPVEVPPALQNVRCISTRGGRFLVGTEPAGVYEWIDRQRWQPVGDVWSIAGSSEWFYPVPTEAVHVRHIAVEPDDPQTIYSAIQVGGVAISRNNGRSWTDRRNLDLDVHMVEPDPMQRGRLYAGSGGGGLYESVDGGESWTCISEACGNFVVQFAIAPSEPNRVYLGTAKGHPPAWVNAGGARGEMFRSDDRGHTWNKLSGGLPAQMESRVNAVAVDPANSDRVFFGGGLAYKGAVAADGGVYGSQDGGHSWRKLLSARETLALWCGAA
jgi:photosystem II stability/assembly factor-like uncharacterized protein